MSVKSLNKRQVMLLPEFDISAQIDVEVDKNTEMMQQTTYDIRRVFAKLKHFIPESRKD